MVGSLLVSVTVTFEDGAADKLIDNVTDWPRVAVRREGAPMVPAACTVTSVVASGMFVAEA